MPIRTTRAGVVRHAVKHAGEIFGLGMMFVREFLVKALLFGLLYSLALSVLFFLDNLWPLWDRDNQTLHDKIVGSYMVYVPRG